MVAFFSCSEEERQAGREMRICADVEDTGNRNGDTQIAAPPEITLQLCCGRRIEVKG